MARRTAQYSAANRVMETDFVYSTVVLSNVVTPLTIWRPHEHIEHLFEMLFVIWMFHSRRRFQVPNR
jgi:hypothetical protein